MLAKIKCPKCETEGSFSTVDPRYEGPYKCWKCRELFTVELVSGELKSCEPLSQEEFDKQQEIEAMKAKFRQG